MTEEWKPIFDGAYSISNLGRVRKEKTGRISSAYVTKGYAEVRLHVEGKRIRRKLAHLVRDAWRPDLPKGQKILHKNKNLLDCSADNLICKPRRMFTVTQVRRIKQFIAEGKATVYHFAKKYDVDYRTIKQIVQGKSYADITVHVNPRKKGIITERSTDDSKNT